MERAGILIRTRFSVRNPGEITGYSVTLPGHVDTQGWPIWYGGGRLSAGLALPRLHRAWKTSHFDRSIPISPQERRAIWSDVTSVVGRAAEHIRCCAGTDPSAAADAAWATADALRSAASVLHGGPSGELLGQAADGYDRAAREIGGRRPGRSPAGVDLRTGARLLSLLGRGGTRPPLAALHLVISLLALAAESVKLRDVQQRIVQADAARTVEVDLRQAAYQAQLPVSGQPWAVEPSQEDSARAIGIAQVDFPRPLHSPASVGSPRSRPSQAG
jgi:hypothetical protein